MAEEKPQETKKTEEQPKDNSPKRVSTPSVTPPKKEEKPQSSPATPDTTEEEMSAALGSDLAPESQSGQSSIYSKPRQSQKVEREKTAQEKELMMIAPVAAVVDEFVTQEKKDIEGYHAYLKSILARNGNKQPTSEEIEKEFRAREMYLAMLDRLKDKVTTHVVKAEKKLKDESKKKQI